MGSLLAALASDVAAMRFRVAAVKLRLALKANFDPNQPRVPRGQGRLSGRWTDTAGDNGDSDRAAPPGGARDTQYIPIGSSDPDDGIPEIWIPDRPRPSEPLRRPPTPLPPARPHSKAPDLPPPRPPDGGKPLDEPPPVPKKRPRDYRAARRVARKVAIWAGKMLLRSSLGPIGHLLTLYDIAEWVYEEFGPEIEAYLQGPKTLAELQADARTARRGYDIHHIVERTPALEDGFPIALVDGPDNLVSIPTYKHWEVTSWMMTPNPEFGLLSPRVYLRGKNWEERRRVGLLGLVMNRVLIQ